LTPELERTLRRLERHRRHGPLRPRPASELPFLDLHGRPPRSLLYDTTVYVDILQGRFPDRGETLLRASDAWHSTVAEGELATACGLLDPAHPDTPHAVRQIAGIIRRISRHRSLGPDRAIWHQAGALTGTLARLQGLARADRRRILNDALLFATARRYGHTVLTRNTSDFDLLQQLDPSGRVLFYRV
jgi:predicted nucleic acid-binding protein